MSKTTPRQTLVLWASMAKSLTDRAIQKEGLGLQDSANRLRRLALAYEKACLDIIPGAVEKTNQLLTRH